MLGIVRYICEVDIAIWGKRLGAKIVTRRHGTRLYSTNVGTAKEGYAGVIRIT